MSPHLESTRISLRDAADRLGVHYMTAYRYVRTGRLPAVKVGAQWRVDTHDVDRLVERTARSTGADGDEPAADRDRATGSGVGTGRRRRTPEQRRRLEHRLLAGDEAGAWSVLEAAMTSGYAPEELHLDLLAPTLRSVGDRWAAGEVTVAEEHRASAVALRLVGRLGPRFVRRGRKRGTVVLGAAPGDTHGLPVAIAADLLRARGHAVIDLGPDVPPQSFVDAALGAERLVAVGIGTFTPGNERALAHAVAAVHAQVGCPVVVGGPASTGPDVGADRLTTTPQELLAAVGDLAPGKGRRPHS
jgi:excisionase family DNA binding protein